MKISLANRHWRTSVLIRNKSANCLYYHFYYNNSIAILLIPVHLLFVLAILVATPATSQQLFPSSSASLIGRWRLLATTSASNFDHLSLTTPTGRRHGRSFVQNIPGDDSTGASQTSDKLLAYSSPTSGFNDNSVETFYIRKGANGTLPCSPVASSSDSQPTMNKIEWFKEDKKLSEAESKRIVVWNTKNSIAYLPDSGALLFRGVTSEDSGEYKCVLTKTTSNSDQSEEGIVRFYVQDVPDPPQMPIVDGFTQRSVNLSWVPSYDYHFSPILHYIIHVREGVDGTWDTANGIMTPDNRTQHEIIGLKPFTTYSFRVLAVNAIGVGDPSPPSHYIITLRQKPDSKLTIISAKNVSSTAIKLEWLPPSIKDIHGEFVGYKIRYVQQHHEHAPPMQFFGPANHSSMGGRIGGDHYSHQGHHQSAGNTYLNRNSPTQSNSDLPPAKEISVGDTQLTSYIIKGLQTFTPYKISVQVTNPAGDGPVAEVLAMTDEGVASPPLELTALKATDTTVKLRWLEPKFSNGILQGYQINLHDIGNNLNDSRRLSDPQSVMEHTIGDLKPYTWYLVNIQAYSRKFLGEPSQQIKFRTDVSAPSAPQLVNVTCFTSESILVQWHKPEQYYNQIDYYYVKYKSDSSWEKEMETAMSAKDKLRNELLITNLTADQMYELKVLAGTRSIHDLNYVYKSEPSLVYRLILQPNCESYTAYPLTESTFNTSMALGVVCASFALALVTVSLIVWRRHCQAAYYYLDEPQDASRGTNSPQLSETYDDSEYGSIPVADWSKHVQKLHADSDIGFTREFEQISSQKNSSLSCEHSNLTENKPKNRYTNIVAYDHTRVILKPPIGGQKKPGFDYINANFIDGYNKPRAYIGTQGPLVSTFDDYWRMIWEHRVVIIVMITNLQERGRRKCDLYWPKDGTETYAYIQVKLLQEVVMATYTLRTFTIKNLKLKKRTGSERTVYQYHYTNWPDHGVPDHPLPVLSFVRKSAAANPPGAGAIICHCSAGCGRSGTYIVIDAMLKQIRHRQTINVVDFLKHIRTQRNYLVQTEEQYIFIHDALVEAIESGETEIPSNLIGKYIQLLQTGGGGGGGSSGKQLMSINSTTSNYSLSNGWCQSPQAITTTMLLNSAGNLASNQQPNSMTGIGGGGGGGGASAELMSNSNSQNNLLIANNGANNTLSATIGSKPSSQATTVSRSQSNQQQQQHNNNNGAHHHQWSLLERQYRLVASFKAKDFCVVSALKPCNKNKNRTLNLIPLEAHRVHITPKPGLDGSDYVNATFLMGFNHLREFIVTQHPVQETYSDFWQMVYDHNSQTIVLLTPMAQLPATAFNGSANNGCDPLAGASKEFGQFWPQKEDEVDYGSFKVKLTQESTLLKAENGNMIITRDFIMRSNQDDYELQTKIIHCPGWPECCGPLSAVFDLIQVVQQATQQQASQQQMHDRLHNKQSQTVTIGQEHEPQNGGPIIVVDKFGGTESATFAVLTTLYKQINFEDAVDVYMYSKLAHLRRPGIWGSQDDYLFLYRAMEQYASNLRAQQQQQQLAANKRAASLAGATTPILQQTMTLDRHHHRHKSSSSSGNPGSGQNVASATLRTSTMGRNKQQQQQQIAFQPFSRVGSQQHSGDFLAKGQQQLAAGLDLNHNSIQYVPASAAPATLAHQHHYHAPPAPQPSAHLVASNQQQLQSSPLAKTEGSPYNSAASIGANSHQHLLIGGGGGGGQSGSIQRSAGAATTSTTRPQLAGGGGMAPAGNQMLVGPNQSADHYIYSIQ